MIDNGFVCNRIGGGHRLGTRDCPECRCVCGRIRVGMKVTENRNWNPDCPEHGIGSEWYVDHPWGGA